MSELHEGRRAALAEEATTPRGVLIHGEFQPFARVNARGAKHDLKPAWISPLLVAWLGKEKARKERRKGFEKVVEKDEDISCGRWPVCGAVLTRATDQYTPANPV